MFPTLVEAKEWAVTYPNIPVCREIYSDVKTPIEVLKTLKTVSRHCFMLESLESSRSWGRYTFLGFDPKLELTCLDGKLTVNSGMKMTFDVVHPRDTIRQILEENRSPRLPGMPPFTGGLVGYFAYDYIKYSEPTLKLDAEDTEGFMDVDLMLFDKVIAFDNLRQKMLLIVNIKTDALETNYRHAEMELENLAQLVRHGTAKTPERGILKSELRPLFTKERYCQMVARAKEFIREGDIFQVVPSNRWEADFEGSLFDAYRVFRTTNPSPYMFYFSGESAEIAGASPETLVKVSDGMVYTFPLAGSRPRGKTEAEDAQLEAELLADPKELAEHNMLVDLGRNDLGKICAFGSVEVERYLQILRFSHIMHIGSTVRGRLRSECTPLDAMDAVLPAGTLSGAPKIRACEIINALENNKRGIYGGAIGYIDFSGNLDTCIGIRIAYKKNGKVFIRAGAGIVADSVPETEFQECVNKSQAVVNAIRTASEGIDL
ncbi:MAG: chorismate-binding protein [Planctomycetia bacterium]|nr:chorismate-binding protein [Planctomycetia bacterium]